MLTSELISQVRRLQFRTSKLVAEVIAGSYRSVFRGQGIEFDEVRPYVPGDDVRGIDWNVTARFGEPYIKRYVEERELTFLLVVDISSSQSFGSKSRSKLETAAEFAALVALSAASNNDKVGLLLFHSEADTYVPPRSGIKHATRIIREVLAGIEQSPTPVSLPRRIRKLFANFQKKKIAAQSRQTQLSEALEFCRKVLNRKTTIFVVSDFLDKDFATTLRATHKKHDVICALVTDEREHSMPKAGLITLVDAESGERRVVDTQSKRFREELERLSQNRIENLRRELTASRIDLLHLDATKPVIDPLLQFFRNRQRRGSR